MKKILFIISATIFTTDLLHAQQTHFGIKGGMNLSSVSIDGGDDYNSKVGVHFGGLAHIHITTHFALQPEVMYSSQGGKDGDFKLRLNYINIPVLAQYMTNDGFRLQTGPQLGILASAKTKSGNVTVDIDDQISSVDFSWVFGASYLFPQGIGLDARYNLGISNVSDDDDFEARNRVFQVGVFYQFMHKHKARRR